MIFACANPRVVASLLGMRAGASLLTPAAVSGGRMEEAPLLALG
jgi:hypothetical protein